MVLSDDLEGWGEARGWKQPQEGGDICIHTADSLRCTAETNTTLESNYLSIKTNKQKILVQFNRKKTFFKG